MIISHRYHLVRPTKDKSSYCSANNLQPYQEWINIHDNDTFLLGPFNFSTIQGRKTKDRIDTQIWQQLHALQDRFDNDAPTFNINLQGYICHVDTLCHSEHQSQSITASINSVLTERYFDN